MKHLLPLMDRLGRYHRYFEPFVGGGAVFFSLQARQKFEWARLNDINRDLIDLYWWIQRHPDQLIVSLRGFLEKYPISEENYLRVRDMRSTETDPLIDAVTTLYLNRTCFNGLFRVSKSGKFNAPYGRWPEDKLPTVLDADNLMACSRALSGVVLSYCDFEAAVEDASTGDLVYFDPPYIPVKSDSFGNGYTKDGFSFADQRRLAALFTSLSERGVGVIASNSDTPVTRELYAGHRIIEVQARRAINSKGDGRGPVGELIIVGG